MKMTFAFKQIVNKKLAHQVRKIGLLMLIVSPVLATAYAGTGRSSGKTKPQKFIYRVRRMKPAVSPAEVVRIARKAYIYGLPIVLTDLTRQAGGAVNNVFSYSHKFPTPANRMVVAPNNDTNYSSAFLDLGDDAVVLRIPDTKGRYFVVPLMDAWTNVFASFGKRTTGTAAQTYVITGPHWKGSIPTGFQEVKSPTDLVWIIGRIQVNSLDDQANYVSKIQDQFTLTLLSNWGKADTQTPPKITRYKTDLPELASLRAHQMTTVQALKHIEVENFFNYLNELMVKNPPLAADSPALREFAKIGIRPGGRFTLNDFDAATQDSLKKVANDFFTAFDAARKTLSNFKPSKGAKIGDYKTDYLTRAAVAYKGLGALILEEATYLEYAFDADKNALDGKNNYVIHFEPGKLPPAQAFWSLTLYDKDRYLSENSIHRYAIGDRSGLKFNADKSLDIYIQHDSPGKDKESNWLPAPEDSFNMTLRMYLPAPAYLRDRSTWQNPPLKKQIQ